MFKAGLLFETDGSFTTQKASSTTQKPPLHTAGLLCIRRASSVTQTFYLHAVGLLCVHVGPPL